MTRPFSTVRSRLVVLSLQNVDTDQIIPARFLKRQSQTGFADALFADLRHRADGSVDLAFPLNAPWVREGQDASILIAGSNFGCGSSREHAAWALRDSGFSVVLSDRIADIFKSNALRNGMLAAEIDPFDHQRLLQCHGEWASVNLNDQAIVLSSGRTIALRIDAFARHCLLQGVDELGYLLGHESEIQRYEEFHACAP